jgi:hypothetical protein
MEEVGDIKLVFHDIDLPPAAGFRCPSCRVEFIGQDVAVNELNPAEEMLEGK